MDEAGVAGEVVVVDNGSTDGSADAAAHAGARVVHERRRGYGAAYMAGFAAAECDVIVMADADGSYDFAALPAFLDRIRDGDDLVMGSRFKGQIEAGAMPWTHQHIGSPILSSLLNMLYRTGIDRSSSIFEYDDPRLLGTRWAGSTDYQDTSDGRIAEGVAAAHAGSSGINVDQAGVAADTGDGSLRHRHPGFRHFLHGSPVCWRRSARRRGGRAP